MSAATWPLNISQHMDGVLAAVFGCLLIVAAVLRWLHSTGALLMHTSLPDCLDGCTHFFIALHVSLYY